MTGAEEIQQKLAKELGRDVFLISAVTGQNLSKFVGHVTQLIAERKREESIAVTPTTEFPTLKAIRESAS